MDPSYAYDCGKDRASAAAALHGVAFLTDPVFQFLVHTLPETRRQQFIPHFLDNLVQSAALNGATFDEAWTETKTSETEPPQCSAIWMPPGRQVDSWRTYLSLAFVRTLMVLGLSGLRRMLFEYVADANKAKEVGLVRADGSKIDKYYYLFLISTAAESRGRGFGSALIRRFQKRCARENIPIWLESTTAGSHRLYLRLGFKDVREWVLGKGVVNEHGIKEKGGNGVPVWAMIWWPEQLESESEQPKQSNISTNPSL